MPDETSYRDVRWLALQCDPTLERNSVTYCDIRCRQLEGTFPGDCMSGVWPISAARIERGWGSVLESDWPQVISIDDWPPPEPDGLDAKAKHRRCHHYQRVRSSDDCRVLLGHGIAVPAAFEITEQWFNAENGMIFMPDPHEEIIGSHAVSIVGFDLVHSCFHFLNSWGADWGVHGRGHLPFNYFDKYFVSSWPSYAVGHWPDYFDFQGVDQIQWGVPDLLGHSVHGGDIIHGREVYDGTNDERMGWAFAVHRRGFLDVEELFVRPQYRRQGIAVQLAAMLLDLSQELKLPLRLWISFADWNERNIPLVEKMVAKLKLSLFQPRVRWAAAVAVSPELAKSSELAPWPDPISKSSVTAIRSSALMKWREGSRSSRSMSGHSDP